MTRYVLDAERSEITFEGRSTFHPIHASSPVRGDLELTDPAAGRVEVAIKEIHTGNPLMDREIRRRLNARREPDLRGDLDALSPAGDDLFVAGGTVTVNGVGQRVEGELAIRVDPDGSVAITGERTFDIRDFGLDPPKLLGLKVEPEVTVRLTAIGRVEADPA